MLKRSNGLVAEDTTLSLIPFRHAIPDQAVLGIRFDLLQAFLAAILALRPSRALIQAKRRSIQKSADRRVGRGDIHRLGFLGLRAGDESLASEAEISTKPRYGPNDKEPDGQHENSNDHRKDANRHRSPPRPDFDLTQCRMAGYP